MKADKHPNGEIELRGTVVEKLYGAGSKSEHKAVCLHTDDGDYPLRRLGGNPFSDPELKKWIGEEVVARGRGDRTLFVATAIEKSPK